MDRENTSPQPRRSGRYHLPSDPPPQANALRRLEHQGERGTRSGALTAEHIAYETTNFLNPSNRSRLEVKVYNLEADVDHQCLTSRHVEWYTSERTVVGTRIKESGGYISQSTVGKKKSKCGSYSQYSYCTFLLFSRT
mmetsp:Transcript_18054/g.31800  ORF Transcript_18054/g.31800 Transcript_18054/m.31800 type:complete len:138 (-) Transcript_18054:76-489(-)